ncbi:S49 family peptidase [Hymenobacter sp. M29]|uniref:S49 family peptidase n=1 Tax=Hymenobacter mellowenesis TaxID=3063995 RepID=A0ABT9AH74_9BACT|nr:S49 family peptidase [Hymenobacter sp. M29]MDO7849223.1 S49 family peptidase [Hymenobacter sp. M29]
MRFNSPLSAALSGQFLLEDSAVPGFLAQLAQLLTATSTAPGQPRPDGALQPAACFAISADATSVQLRGYGSLDEVPAGSVAVTVVRGVMMPEDDYDWDYGYVPGTRTLGARIQQADAHPNIIAHVGHFITPGGSVMGVESFADIVAGTTKPFVSFVDMMCSAGAWSGCGADKIVVGKTGITGSIGTKWDGLDMSGYLEKMGLKQVTVTATESTEKTRAFDEALKGKPALLRSQMLDPLNDVFVAAIKQYRPNATPDTLTGKLFVGQAAVDAGLADQVGSLQDAIQLAFDLAGEAGSVVGSTTASSFSSTNPQSPTMSLFGNKNKTTALTAVLALSGQTGLTAETTKAANEELAAAGITDAAIITQSEYTDLVAKAGQVATLTASVNTLTADKTKLTTDLATANTALTASQAEVTRLGALGGAAPTTAGKAEGDQQDAPKAHAWFDKNADHNKDAEALLS